MRNVKIRFKGGRTLIRRLPKHTPSEIQQISGAWVATLGGGKEFVPGYPTAQLRKRSKSRAANKQARLARRVTRHGR